MSKDVRIHRNGRVVFEGSYSDEIKWRGLIDHVVDLYADTDLSVEEFSAALDEAKARVSKIRTLGHG